VELELLYEPAGLPAFDLPPSLAALYPGTLGFDEPCVFANFVATTDGVVAIPSIPLSNKLIAARNPADRFVMGLLRACADCVALGSGTLAASPKGLWSPAQAYPDAATGYDELRAGIGRTSGPEIAILSTSGDVDPGHPLFEAGGIVVTTDAGAARLDGRLPSASEALPVGPAATPGRVLDALRARGHRLILHEGGPHVIGSFLAAGAVDELFLTVSPLLTGRPGTDVRLALVEGSDLLPGVPTRLLGARRETDHLMLRYGIIRP
jgi:riboflavin biosynthesis pyrimidine reductase